MIFLLFLLLPIVEIYILIQVAGEIGFWPVFGVVVFTAWLGFKLLKFKGIHTLAQAQERVMSGQSPRQEVLDGVIIMLGGLLLIAPGLITDSLGFLCLIPPSRRIFSQLFLRWLKSKVKAGRVQVFTSGFGSSAPHDPFSRPMKDVTPEQPKELDQNRPN